MARFWRSSLSPPLFYHTICSSTTPPPFHLRHFSTYPSPSDRRNIWFSGLTDPGKPTLVETSTEYEGGKSYHRMITRIDYGLNFMQHIIRSIRERRAADTSYIYWIHHWFNIIHTPDFTIDAESALRAFDSGATHFLCSVNGLQSQSITADKLMIRYKLPRLVFIDKLDRKGANPWQVLNQVRSKLQRCSAAIQVPIGLEDDFKGLVDLVQLKAYSFHGSNGEKAVVGEVPADMEALVLEKRRELIETLSEVDDKLAETFSSGKVISEADLKKAVRRATIAQKFIPVFMGNAFIFNNGLQLLLDGVINYLPCPIEAGNYALNQSNNGKKHTLMALAFTLEEKREYYGKITYLRIYEGVIKKGDVITNINTGKTFKVPHLFKKYNNKLDVNGQASVGEIVCVYDVNVNLAAGDTFTEGLARYTVTSADVSESVSRHSGVQGKGDEYPGGSVMYTLDGKLHMIILP